MIHFNFLSKSLLLVAISLIFSISSIYAASEAVASLQNIKGIVQVAVKTSGNLVSGKEGLILRDGDVVVTGQGTNVSIIFRDGSEIRLFQNTRFLIERAEETKTSKRSFRYKFIMKLGSFWGRFMKGRQETEIETPTATIGIKGTAFRLNASQNSSSILLSEGVVVVKNDDEEFDLHAGKLIGDIPKTGSFKKNVKDIPYQLTITSKTKKIPFGNKQTRVQLTLQLVDRSTNQNYNKSGVVQLSSTLNKKMIFPSSISLNSRGYASVTATIKSVNEADFNEGEIQVFAYVVDEIAPIGSGQITFPFDRPGKKRNIRIDMKSGEVNTN